MVRKFQASIATMPTVQTTRKATPPPVDPAPTRAHPNQMRNAATGRLTSHMARLNRLPRRIHLGPTHTHTEDLPQSPFKIVSVPETSAERIHLRHRDERTPPTRVSLSGPFRATGAPALSWHNRYPSSLDIAGDQSAA